MSRCRPARPADGSPLVPSAPVVLKAMTHTQLVGRTFVDVFSLDQMKRSHGNLHDRGTPNGPTTSVLFDPGIIHFQPFLSANRSAEGRLWGGGAAPASAPGAVRGWRGPRAAGCGLRAAARGYSISVTEKNDMMTVERVHWLSSF